MGRNRSEVVECFDSDILSILRCVSSLDELVNDVLSCMCCKPSDRRIQQILTCVVLNEVSLLSNATFGLNEIKNEVRFIENEVTLINNSVNSPVFGLRAVNNDIKFIENEVVLINNSVNNPVFGLNAIKNDIRFIENEVVLINNSVNSPVFGLNSIKNDVRFIENEVVLINNNLNNQVFGLSSIKNDVRFIENEVILINNSVNSPVFGLNSIKNDIRFIENEVILINNSVNSPVLGLNSIKNDVRFIENEVILINKSINSKVFGLSEIESKVRLIEEISLHEFPELTSGPVFVGQNARRLTVKIFNNTDTEHTVRVRVLDLERSPVTEIFDKFLRIKAFSTNQFTNIELLEHDGCCSCGSSNDYDYDDFDEKARAFEIVLTDMVAGLYPAAVQTQKDRQVIDSTFIKSADFIPKVCDVERQ